MQESENGPEAKYRVNAFLSGLAVNADMITPIQKTGFDDVVYFH